MNIKRTKDDQTRGEKNTLKEEICLTNELHYLRTRYHGNAEFNFNIAHPGNVAENQGTDK